VNKQQASHQELKQAQYSALPQALASQLPSLGLIWQLD
jgi:hypothetical protein